MIRYTLPLALGLLWAVGAAWAQAPTVRIRGTITAVEAATLAVTSREGQALKIALVEPVTVSVMKKVDLASIAPGTYVGMTARPGAGNELQAVAVVVFPENLRGVGEGHRDWDLAPGTTMTNANVEAAVQGSSGRDLTLAYKGGSVKVLVGSDAPVVTPVPADRADLKPGATVFLSATRAADGALSASRITVSKDGVAPPM